MSVTNTASGTNIHQIADGIYRISTPIPPTVVPGGFSFNQYLVVDEEPLLLHAGPRRLFPVISEAVATILPVDRLRYLTLSHVEADECGGLNEWLAAAPQAVPVCSQVAALVSVADLADRPPRGMSDGETLPLGARTVQWLDAPHMPHAWECGYMLEQQTRTLLCGDLFTQGGHELPPLTEADILGPSEGFRDQMDYYSHTKRAHDILERLAATDPTTLACMHGSAWQGDGASLLRDLSHALAP